VVKMLKSKLREKCEGVHIQIGLLFSKIGISANTWTVLSLVPAALGFISLCFHSLPTALIFFAASGFVDMVDGNVARVTKSVSNLGAFLDGVIDRYVEFLLYLGLWIYLEHTDPVLLPIATWMLLLLFGALMPSFVTAYADHRNVISDPDRLKNIGGFLERFERLALLYFGMLLGIFSPIGLVYVIILTVFLTNLTAIQRIFNVIRSK
jgi:archaetidylinositol phosphate synthase